MNKSRTKCVANIKPRIVVLYFDTAEFLCRTNASMLVLVLQYLPCSLV